MFHRATHYQIKSAVTNERTKWKKEKERVREKRCFFHCCSISFNFPVFRFNQSNLFIENHIFRLTHIQFIGSHYTWAECRLKCSMFASQFVEWDQILLPYTSQCSTEQCTECNLIVCYQPECDVETIYIFSRAFFQQNKIHLNERQTIFNRLSSQQVVMWTLG